MNIKVLIATHKSFSIPESNIFLPLHVGKENKEDLGYVGDNSGDNISIKNNTFCELTGLYWAWKNLDYDVLGLCHYRRYFDIENKTDNVNDVRYITENEFKEYSFSKEKIKKYLNKYHVILPKPKVYETSLEKEYGYSHSVEDYEILTTVINELYPEYSKNWLKTSHFSNKLIHYNMFIAPKHIIDDYCEWLFTILFEIEKKIKLSPHVYQQRVFGFMAERLMTLYFYHNKFNIKQLPILYVKDKEFPYKTSLKATTFFSNSYKNFLFFLASFPKKIKQYLR